MHLTASMSMARWRNETRERSIILICRASSSRCSEIIEMWNVRAYPELRVQVSPTRYRVPDLCVLRAGQARTPIVVEAPLLCIEILSPEDRFGRIRKKCDEYLQMGVIDAWIFDAEERLVFRFTGTAR